MTNIKIKGEDSFKELFEQLKKQSKGFKALFGIFDQALQEKRVWVDSRSDKWHSIAENETFNAHLSNVEDFRDKLRDNLDELEELEYPLDNE